MMNILAFDTCLNMCSVAAGRALRSLTPAIACAAEPMTVGHAERLMPMIADVLDQVRLKPVDLDRIAVTSGPGTFAGTRIAVSAARALALGTRADIVTVSSLNLLAMHPEIPASPGRRLIVVTDARRGEVYLQAIDRHTLRALSPPLISPVSRVVDHIGAGPVTFAGSGAQLAHEAATRAGIESEAVATSLWPDAFDMLFAAFDMTPQTDIMPLYLRPPDAKPPPSSQLVGPAV